MNKLQKTLAMQTATMFLCLLLVNNANAEIRTITATGEYRMGDNDTRTDAKRLALLDAKRLALEQAGTYIESITGVKNFDLSKEEIRAYTAGIVEVTEQATRTMMEGETTVVRVDVIAKIDTNVVTRQIDALRKDETMKAELQKIYAEKDQLRQKVDAQTKELAAFKSKADAGPSVKRRQQVMVRLEVEDLLARARVALNRWGGREGEAVALNLAKEALARDPDHPEAHRMLGNVLSRHGKYEAAIRAYRTALRIQPDSADTHYDLGEALFLAGELADAMNEYRSVLHFEPSPILMGAAHDGIGEVLAKREDFTGAIEEFRTALRLWPDFAEAHSNLGQALFKTGDLTGALAESRVAVRLAPEAAIGHARLAGLLYQAGDLDGAIEESRVAARLKPEDPVVHYGLGSLLLEAGKREEGARELREFLKLAPATPDFQPYINYARAALGVVDK